ncbi:hypothetical protein Lepto7376_3805 [[Leptolyngbya] sp. PCC 7376]|uniref:CU044_2847 family protein n=1 Tax=[Leptolyngbya] sp. PCC 7376 TaxID=111781 RepID=UPI00029ED71C|nr:CU044_2847 family protein [[Leptolyngbya] sp. PCC 7376]AFY39966.1 hypothetical protein Lepto7376_3805 [[Leptolyngbya] sp. PCC 7376]
MAIVEFKRDDGSSIYMEVEDKLAGSTPATHPDLEGLAGIGDVAENLIHAASQTFEGAMSSIKDIGNSIGENIVQRVQEMNEPADEVEVTFGVNLAADLGAIVAKTGGEVNYEITLKWDNREKNKQKKLEQQQRQQQQAEQTEDSEE